MQLQVGTHMKLLKHTITFLVFGLSFICGASTASAATLEVLASGLENPRQIAFGPDGALYVAEAGTGGSGPVILGPDPGVFLRFGTTGAVTRVDGNSQTRVVSGLPSLALTLQDTIPTLNVGDPLSSVGPHGLEFDRRGNAYVLLGYASTASEKEVLGPEGTDVGRLLSYNVGSNGTWTRNTDFSIDLLANRELYNPYADGDYLNNPYDLEIVNEQFVIADAGGNNYFTVDSTGNIALQSRFSPFSVNGATVESVPTSITLGPDGAYYVGEFTGAPYPEGGARVYRVLPGGEPEVYASDFTQIIGLDFDSEGNLYVLEYSVNSTSDPNVELLGRITRIAPDGTRKILVSPGEGLIAPNGLTVGPDGAIYVSNRSNTLGQGEVVRVKTSATVPEPSSMTGLLVLGTLGTGLLLKRKVKTETVL